MLLNCDAGEYCWESLGIQGDQISTSQRKSALNTHRKDWCWSWSSSTLVIWCKELTLWKRPWCWERLRAGGEGSNRGWEGWMTSLLNGHEFDQTPGDSEGQGRLSCCSPWVLKVSDTTEKLNHNNSIWNLKKKNVTDKSICGDGIEKQTQRMNGWTHGW